MKLSQNILPIGVTEDFVLSKCNYFTDVQVWPLRMKLDPPSWLKNFTAAEKEHALYLLNSFIYFPPQFVNQLFMSAFNGLSSLVADPEQNTFPEMQRRWGDFVDRVLVTNVTGEVPSVTDSGLSFARKAKQLLGIDERRILSNEATLEEISTRPTPVVFVDDFVGSGNQFIETWHRLHQMKGASTSFAKESLNDKTQFFYIPLVSTEYGLNCILGRCDKVIVAPAQLITDKYNVFNEKSRAIWPPHLIGGARDFIKLASERAGISTVSDDDWMGFHRLGLSIGFEDSIPDATLPLFSWDKCGWTPLLKIT